jgi:hypothetical protein
MKLILILLEIYAGGFAFLFLLAFGLNFFRNEGKFDVEMKLLIWLSILWPIMALTPLLWIRDLLRERREFKGQAQSHRNADKMERR